MKLKKNLIAIATLFFAAAFMSLRPAEKVITEVNGVTVINTTTLADDVEGYAGATPLEVHIKKNKIVKVVVLKNMDGPKYNAKVKKEMLTKYEGMDVKKGTVQDVDAVTGATFTSKAMQENIRRAVDYYKKHK
jgi:electron transport complex protein RnfG